MNRQQTVSVSANNVDDPDRKRIGLSKLGGMMSTVEDSRDVLTVLSNDGGGRIMLVENIEHLSSSVSSIGRNSDDKSTAAWNTSGGEEGQEVQSKFKGGALDNLQVLEEVLPMKRSISQFYSGKSKSFSSLVEAETCTTIKDIVKPEDSYTRKRKNSFARNILLEPNRKSNNSKRNSGARHINIKWKTSVNSSSDNLDSNMLSTSVASCFLKLPPSVTKSDHNHLSSPPLN